MEVHDSDAGSDEETPLEIDVLPFQQDIVEELLREDGLTVIGKGLGLCSVAAALLHVHSASKHSGGVVIILGAPLPANSAPAPDRSAGTPDVCGSVCCAAARDMTRVQDLASIMRQFCLYCYVHGGAKKRSLLA